MKKLTAVLLAALLMLVFTACHNELFFNDQDYYDDYNGNNDQNSTSEKTASIDEIISGFRDAGYIIEQASAEDDPDMDPANADIDGLVDLTGYHFGKKTSIYDDEYLVEEGSIVFLKMQDAAAAKAYFDMTVKYASDDPQWTVTTSKLTRRAVVGDRSDYGSSDVLCLAGDTLISMSVDWDDYQDAGITYHFKPEQILEDLGY